MGRARVPLWENKAIGRRLPKDAMAAVTAPEGRPTPAHWSSATAAAPRATRCCASGACCPVGPVTFLCLVDNDHVGDVAEQAA